MHKAVNFETHAPDLFSPPFELKADAHDVQACSLFVPNSVICCVCCADPWAHTGPPSPNSAAAAALFQQQPPARSNKWVRPGDPAAAAAAAATAAATASVPVSAPPRATPAAAQPAAAVTAEAAMLASVVAKQDEYMAHLKKRIAAQEAALKRKGDVEARKRPKAAGVFVTVNVLSEDVCSVCRNNDACWLLLHRS